MGEKKMKRMNETIPDGFSLDEKCRWITRPERSDPSSNQPDTRNIKMT
jgi:hypothetical protein